MWQKLIETNTSDNGFCWCNVQPLDYPKIKIDKKLLPMKNGRIFNPEYQHLKVILWKKGDLVEDYYAIKKEIKKLMKSPNKGYDLSYYKIFSGLGLERLKKKGR